MIRCRFHCNADDPRPVNWPIKHPYWVTGEAGDGSFATVVAYADDEAEVLRNWPDARHLDSMRALAYAFSDRFPKPDWLQP